MKRAAPSNVEARTTKLPVVLMTTPLQTTIPAPAAADGNNHEHRPRTEPQSSPEVADLLQELAQLAERRAQLVSKAKDVAYDRMMRAAEDLAALGFKYSITPAVDGEQRKTRKASSGTSRGSGKPKEGPCSVCGFETLPPHDARTHRHQDPKRPLTAAELKERQWTKK